MKRRAWLRLGPNAAEEAQQGLQRALSPDPQPPLGARVNLVDEGEVLVPTAPGQLVDPERLDAVERPVLEAPLDRHFHGAEDVLPEASGPTTRPWSWSDLRFDFNPQIQPESRLFFTFPLTSFRGPSARRR